MTRPRWTAEEDARLLAMHEQGHTFTAIGKALGKGTTDHRACDNASARFARLVSAQPAPPPVELAAPSGAAIVGVIGDTHLPFAVDGYLDFCANTFTKWGVSRIVHIGDLFDNHAISYHETDPDGLSAGREYEQAIEAARQWYAAFPVVDWLQGNHDRLPSRRMMTAGLPRRMLRDRLFERPPGWQPVDSVVIDDVLYTHGLGTGGGINGARLLALRRAQSCVIGHWHHSAGVAYIPERDGVQRFGMTVGCGVDRKQYAFDYAREYGSMALGCGVVIEGREAHYIPMPPR